MRTDVKAGLLIALVLVVVGLYFFVFRPSAQQPATPPEEPAWTEQQEPEGQGRVVVSDSEEQATPPLAAHGGQEPPPAQKAKEPPETPLKIAYAEESAPPWGPAQAVGKPLAEEPSTYWWTDSERPRQQTLAVEPEPTPKAPAADVYRVKEGDSYYSIAKAVYGDANLYPVLVRANPNIPPRSLMPKMTIKVPPRPTKPSSEKPSPAAGHGLAGADLSTGQRYYVVKEGDNGFWGISLAVFKTPKRWREIESLNPGLDPRSLKPGQKVRVPVDVVDAAGKTSPRLLSARGPAAEASRTGWSGTGVPARTTLPDGRVFD